VTSACAIADDSWRLEDFAVMTLYAQRNCTRMFIKYLRDLIAHDVETRFGKAIGR